MSTISPKPRVLFVDDEPRILTSMRMLFRGTYELHFAESGAQALELLKTQTVDAIVSDQRMPGMSGFEFLREARTINPHAMRILLTGYSDLNAIIGSVNEGEIFRFVNKPWANDVLLSTVAMAVNAAKSSQTAVLAPPPPVAASASAAPAILVLDDTVSTAKNIQTMLGDQFRVFGAASMDDAIAVLERERIGVLVSESRVQGHPVVALVGLLKQHQPQLVTVILTNHADATSAVDLINQGQIYRLMTKPVQDVTCRIMVASAYRQHQHLLSVPVLHQRYAVAPAEPLQPAAEPPPALRFLDRVRALKAWVVGR